MFTSVIDNQKEYEPSFPIPVSVQFASLCSLHWLGSNEDIQERYPAHERTLAEVKDLVARYTTPQVDMDTVFMHAIDLYEGWFETEYEIASDLDEEGNALKLEQLSFLACRFGGVASYGDLDGYVQYLEGTRSYNPKAIRPSERLSLYVGGHVQHLCVLLNRHATRAEARFQQLVASGTPPSIWIPAENEDETILNAPVLETEYHLLRSLMHCAFGGSAGHA